MRGGKDEEKFSSPMFPRLHVNDTDKGGPRAPPRNKMALYEQLSIPSQRFNSSGLPLLPQNARNLGSPSSQGNGHEGTVFSPFYGSPLLAAYSAEKINPQFSDGENMRVTRMEFEKRSTRHMDFKSANAVGSIAECSSLHQRNSSNEKDCQKRVDDDDDDDFRVPTFINLENALYLSKDANGIDINRKTPHTNRARNGSDQPLEQTSISDVKSGENERKCKQKLDNAVVTEVHNKKSLLHPEAGDKLAELSRFSKPSFDLGSANNHGLCQESRGGSITWSESQPNGPLGERTVNVRDTCSQKNRDKENRSLEQQEADRNDEDSETSMVDSDSVSELEISPDDVVGMIGQKQFWKARRAIVNQQRVFSVQVFELHRLIKVQKLLAASPHLIEKNSYVAPQKVVPSKNQHLEPYAKPQPHSVKQTDDDSQKPNQNTDSHMESTEAHPLPLYNDAVKEAPPFSPAHEIRSNPWCYPPLQHQWLVPVMSPSEGLIYKPCSAPCPAATGFMAPAYGNYSPMRLPTALPTAYQIHSHPQQNYYPNLYGQMISNSAVDQMSPMTGQRTNIHAQQNSRSSCNMSFPKSDAFTARNLKAHKSKDSGLQGSSASSPSERAGGEGRNALPLFPVGPMPEASVNASDSNCEGHQTHVIRVVPHNNARSATESAARIFRSIQEGRQHHD